MKYYIDIVLLSDPEVPLNFLWQKVYRQLHSALVKIQEQGKVNVGVAFPGYDDEKHQLGNRLRLFAAEKENLLKLNPASFLAALTDYIQITKIRPVPEKVAGHAFFKRIQPKNNNARLARRRAKRTGSSYQEAIAYFDGRTEVFCDAPFIRIKSHSSGKAYRLMIQRERAESAATTADFSTYGLSHRSSVPIF